MRSDEVVLDEALALAWDAAGDAMAISDRDGIVLLANPAYHALYGYGPGEVIGRSFAVIFPEGERAAAEAGYRAAFQGPTVTTGVEAVVRLADGGERVVEARYSFLMRGERRTAMLSTVRDITERKRLEAALREEVATLETLNRTGQQVAAELDLRALVQAVTDAACHGSLSIWGENAASGSGETSRAGRLRCGGSPCILAARARRQ